MRTHLAPAASPRGATPPHAARRAGSPPRLSRLCQALGLALLAACGASKPSMTVAAPPPGAGADVALPAPPPDEAPAGKPVTTRTLAAVGLDPGALDRAADPCDDFYQFACGGWIARTEIPADKPAAMRSFIDIDDRNQAYLHDVLEKLRAAPGADPAEQQLGAFYGGCMDEAAIEKAGLGPVRPWLAKIAAVKDARALARVVAELHAAGFDPLFALGPTQDARDARQVIAGLDQGGMLFPDRDYYLKDDDATKAQRAAYLAFATDVLTQAGRAPAVAAREAAAVLALETELAKVSKDKVARRDPQTMYNRLDKAGVATAAPSFDWATLWKTTGITSDAITVGAPGFLTGVEALVKATPAATWRAYLTLHVIADAAALLPRRIEEARFKFAAVLTGQPEMEPRWKRCVGHTDGAIGDLLAQVYVRDRFPGASKSAAEEQVAAITAAMKANLDALPWMDAATRAKAHAKLAAMTNQIGYPNKWRTYPFKVDRAAWGATALAARAHEARRQLAKIGKPDDRDDWYFTAPTVNAYYDSSRNGMVFPAGILQPPFYALDAAVAVNLGAMGVVVGHELTHGFDDQGAQFDADGNMVNWWQPETAAQFAQRTRCVIDQYAAYDAGGGKVNGANTVGENIADIGGVKLALAGYRALRASAPDAVVADGFTEDQQFFLGFGQAWCMKARAEYEKMLVTVDVHAPARWRVNGSLQATPEFARAFQCKAGAKMAPAKTCSVW